MPADPAYVDVEVVSPGGKTTAQPEKADPLFALVAKLMDNIFQIPGTNIKFGLDPLLGLIPGLGDTSGAIVSALLILRGSRAGIPRVILVRMALNVILNALGGSVPVLGDLFSVWFKSNQLNYALYQKHAGRPAAAERGDWLFVIGLLVALLAVVGSIIAVSLLFLTALWKYANAH